LTAALVVLTVVLIGKSAFATCGDYLLHNGMSGAATPLASESGRESPQAEPQSPPGKPCDGPHCRQTPQAPAAPAAPLKWAPHTDLAIVTSANAGANGIGNRRPDGGPAHQRPGHPHRIDRPPRAS
jgi:hypothetical protein